MEKRCGLFVFKGVLLLLLVLLAAKESSGTGLLTSLQFTRDAFTGFSRGSGRTVDILTPKLMPGRPVPPPPQEKPMKPVDWESTDTDRHKLHVKKKTFTRFVKKKTSILRPTKRPAITRPNPTLITYVRKRKTYRPRSSPSNKFLEAISDIERAVANARAEGSSYNKAIVDKFTLLLEQAVRRKSYKYGREILGKILYLFNAKLEASRRGKRSSQNEGNAFLLGLRQRLGDTTFDSFMAVQGDVSLVFVIDDTGSMADEIQATKNIAIDIINYPREAPVVDYILSPFNDPTPDVFPLIHKEESEAGEFVQAINSLTAHGGGDCPEYAFRGMLEAMAREPQWGSPMFVFTDAGPKDATEENMLEMMDFVYNYGVTINFFTTGYCRSQGFSGQDPRNLHPKFRELAEYTGGQAILLRNQWELEQLNGLTGGGLEGTNVVSIGSNLSNRKRRSRERRDSQYRFPVDDSIQKITVSVSTTQLQTNAGQGITLTDPDGIVISTGKVALSQICIYQITDPKDGEWTIDVSGENGGHEFYVKSSSETSVDFEHYFVIPVSGRRRRKAEVPIFNAVVGIMNKLVITVAASEKVDSSSLSLELINKNGEHIRDVSIQSNDSVHYTASLVPPSAPFKLKLKGRTLQGKPFERISHRTVLPKTAVLRGKYASNSYSLPLNRITFIHFQLCNFGPSEYFNTTVVKDKMGYMIGNTHNRMRVLKNRCVTIRLRAKATRLDDVEKMDTVFVIAKGESSQVNVAQSMRLFVVRRL